MNALTQNTVTTSDIFDDSEWLEAVAGKPAPTIKLPDDPIALGCASYRLSLQGLGQYHELDQLPVQPADRDMAQNIRNYYRAKITWQMLKNTNEQRPVSEFRRKLMGIIENNYDITQNEMGILYRIPYFYVEDREHDAIFADLPDVELVRTRAVDLESTFTLMRKVHSVRRAYDNTQYWFKLSDTSVPAMVVIKKDNSLQPLFESIVSRGPVRLRADWHPKTMWGNHEQDRWYYQLGRIKLA